MLSYMGKEATRKNAYDAMEVADPLNHARRLLHDLNEGSHGCPVSYRSTVSSSLPRTS